MLDFLRGSCYSISEREENKAEFHSHLSAYILYKEATWVYIAQEHRQKSVVISGYNRVWILSALFFMDESGRTALLPVFQRVTGSQIILITE